MASIGHRPTVSYGDLLPSLYADVRAASRPTIAFQYGNSFGWSNAVYTYSHRLPGFTHLPPGGATYAGRTLTQNYEGCHTQV